jgi:(S)-3,5-dihydroxyphenylglycine transaminase
MTRVADTFIPGEVSSMPSSDKTETGRSALARVDLHPSLGDPALSAIGFLNEIMDRYPRAISFAPGAPFAGFFDDIELNSYLARYTEYLAREKGFSPARIRKHLYQYGPSIGLINDLLAQALQHDQGIAVAPEAIVVTVGCQEAILLVLRALCRGPDDVLAVVNPCFAGIAGAARLLDMPMLAIDESADGIDWAQLEQECRSARQQGKRVRALYMAPDFSNPSGLILSLEARQRLLAMASQEDFLLIEDNAYGFTATDESALPTLKALDREQRVIYLGTCAKICMPGVRVGFLVADQRVDDGAGAHGYLAGELATLKTMVTVNTSPICQAIVGGMLLEHGVSIAAMARLKGERYRDNMAYLLGALERHIPNQNGQQPQVGWNRPAGGFFVRMRLPVAADMALLDYCAAHYGVLWTPMSFFHLGDGGRAELRLSCSYLTLEQIEEGVRRLAAFLRDERVRGLGAAAATPARLVA